MLQPKLQDVMGPALSLEVPSKLFVWWPRHCSSQKHASYESLWL